jgi:hypothetical protein
MTKRALPLLDDPSTHSGVRELLQAGRDSHVSDYDYGSGLERHMAQIQAGAPMPEWAKGLEAGAGKGAAAAATAAGTGLVGWWALPVATVAVAAAIGAVVLFRGEETVPVARPHGVGVSAAPAPAAQPVAVPAVVPAAPAVAEPVAREQRAAAATPRDNASRGATPRSGGARSGSAFKPVQPKHAQSVANTHTAAPGSAASTRDTTNAAARTTASSSGSTTAAKGESAPAAQAAQPEQSAVASEERPAAQQEPAPVIDDSRLEREMGMLAVAQRVLQDNPARTLSLTRQGEAEFAGSMFTQERQQLELLALVKLGRLDEAKRLARPYLAHYPNGPFSDRVRRALSTGRVER